MENPEQVFYIKYADDGYIIGQLTQKGYDNLSNDDKKNYEQVFVDQSHLNGWGKYWNTVRYVNGALNYPDNWPSDQSEQINQLSSQVKQLSTNNQYLQKQFTEANNKSTDLTKIVMKLQLALAKAQQEGEKNA